MTKQEKNKVWPPSARLLKEESSGCCGLVMMIPIALLVFLIVNNL